MNAEEFEVDLSAGTVTISSGQALSTILNRYVTEAERLDGNFVSVSYSQPKILFQIKVEKYRSISDARDLTSEQVNKIATAQAIEAAILEYNYQFNLATQTQLGFHEIVYTTIVTAISTALSMATTFGVGSIVSSLVNPAKEVSSKLLGRMLGSVLQGTASFTAPIVARAVVKEIGQELLLDPWIESTVSGLVRRAGGDAIMQMVLSSIAESGREALTGPLTNLINPSQSQQTSFMSNIESEYFAKGLKPTVQDVLTAFNEYRIEIRAQQEQRKEQMRLLGGATRALSFVSVALGFAASQFLGPVGALVYSTLATYCFSEDISLKNVFRQVFNPVMVAVSKVGESKIGDYYKGNKKRILLTLGIGVVAIGLKALQILLPPLAIIGGFTLGFGIPISIGMTTGKKTLDTLGSKYGPEETLMRRLTFTFLEEVIKSAPVTQIKESLRKRGISGYGARGLSKTDLVRLALTRISRESLSDDAFGWSTTSWTAFKSLAKYFSSLGQGSYSFSDRIFSKKFDKDGNHMGAKWRSDTIEQLIDLLETLQNNEISSERRRRAILALNKYSQVRGLRNFQNILNKPEWVLTKALQKVFSDKFNRFISMDELSIMLIGASNKGYFRSHFTQKSDFPQFEPFIVKQIESFCRDNLDANSMILISTLIATWRILRDDVAYGAPTLSNKQRDIDLINSIRTCLEPLFNKPLNNLELGKFFEKKTLFTDVSNLNSKRKFKARDIDAMIDIIRNKLVPKSVLDSGWDKAYIARDVLKELGNFRAKFYLDEEVKMLIKQVTYGYDKDGYPVGWRSSKMRRLQTEILWLQQKGRCAISGEPIILGRDKIARHHIEGIKSKSTIKDLVLVLDEYHGEVKKASVKQQWITVLLNAKKAFTAGKPPSHWDTIYITAFRKAFYGWKLVDGIRTRFTFWRADMTYYY